jgi:hypothetical protein
MVVKAEEVKIKRVIIYDISDGSELKFEIDTPNTIKLTSDMQIITPEFLMDRSRNQQDFDKLDKDLVEKYLINQQQYDMLMSRIRLLDSPNIYPTFFEQSKVDGAKTTENTATELIQETGHSKYIKD